MQGLLRVQVHVWHILKPQSTSAGTPFGRTARTIHVLGPLDLGLGDRVSRDVTHLSQTLFERSGITLPEETATVLKISGQGPYSLKTTLILMTTVYFKSTFHHMLHTT